MTIVNKLTVYHNKVIHGQEIAASPLGDLQPVLDPVERVLVRPSAS